jgi:hypothetical protein
MIAERQSCQMKPRSSHNSKIADDPRSYPPGCPLQRAALAAEAASPGSATPTHSTIHHVARLSLQLLVAASACLFALALYGLKLDRPISMHLPGK